MLFGASLLTWPALGPVSLVLGVVEWLAQPARSRTASIPIDSSFDLNTMRTILSPEEGNIQRKPGNIYEQACVKTVAGFFHGISKHPALAVP